jgi:hypothetical protein
MEPQYNNRMKIRDASLQTIEQVARNDFAVVLTLTQMNKAQQIALNHMRNGVKVSEAVDHGIEAVVE